MVSIVDILVIVLLVVIIVSSVDTNVDAVVVIISIVITVVVFVSFSSVVTILAVSFQFHHLWKSVRKVPSLESASRSQKTAA